MYTAKDTTLKDVKNTASNIGAEARDTAYDVKNEVADAADKASKKVRGFFRTASSEISHASDTVTSQIRTSPVQSSVIALGVGFLLGSLFRRV